MNVVDLSAYSREIQELRDWLADGPKSAADFDSHFSTVAQLRRGIRVTGCFDNAPILGSLSQGIGPYTWAGRLELLQLMFDTGEVRTKQRDGTLWYKLTEPEGNGAIA